MPRRLGLELVLCVGCLVLTGCKQDRILHDAAGFDAFQSSAAPLIAEITGDPVASCIRIKEYNDLTRFSQPPAAVLRELLAPPSPTPAPPPGPTATPTPFLAPPATFDPVAAAANCTLQARTGAVWRRQFDALFAFAAAIAAAGNAKNVDLNAAGFAKDLNKANVLAGGNTDAAVGTVIDELAKLSTSRERAKGVVLLIKAVDPSIQSINSEIQARFASEKCDPLTYCDVVRQEVDQADLAYGRIVNKALRSAANRHRRRPPGAQDAPTLSTADSAALIGIRKQWAQVHDDARKRITDARVLADLTGQLASSSHDLYKIIVASPNPDTALFER